MHEMSLLNDLLAKVRRIAAENDAERVLSVTVTLGPLAHISAAHLQEHFDWATRDTDLAGAELVVHESHDRTAPGAQSILLETIDVE